LVTSLSASPIALMSTHNPLLALSSDRRLVIRNGGIAAIIKTSDEERQGYGLSLICSR